MCSRGACWAAVAAAGGASSLLVEHAQPIRINCGASLWSFFRHGWRLQAWRRGPGRACRAPPATEVALCSHTLHRMLNQPPVGHRRQPRSALPLSGTAAASARHAAAPAAAAAGPPPRPRQQVPIQWRQRSSQQNFQRGQARMGGSGSGSDSGWAPQPAARSRSLSRRSCDSAA